MQEKILFVDDEWRVLQGFQRLLQPTFQIETALSAAEALGKLTNNSRFAVVVCDMRMPEMDGVRLLTRIRTTHPEIVRIMLTGNSDQETAIQAVNEGHIFRFLTKPCAKPLLVKTLNDALIQFRLANNQQDLVDKARYGHSLAPWTVDPTSASYREIEQKVQELGTPETRTVQPSQGGFYVGRIISVGPIYVAQCLSPTRVIVHPKNLLSRIPQVGEFVRIDYNDSQGQVAEIPVPNS